jgi:hypothetical protein
MCKSVFTKVQEIEGQKRRRLFEHENYEQTADDPFENDEADDSNRIIGAYGYEEDGFVVDDDFVEYCDETSSCNDSDDESVATYASDENSAEVSADEANKNYSSSAGIVKRRIDPSLGVVELIGDDAEEPRLKRYRIQNNESEMSRHLDFNSLMKSFAFVDSPR